MNCKFKFHLWVALHRGAARPAGSAEVGGPTGGPDEALPDLVGADGPVAPPIGLLFSDLQVHGSRSKTEFISFAGRRAQTRAGRWAPFFGSSGLRFALENRVHWLCGQAGANPAGRRAPFFGSSGPRFALENRVHWLCGQVCANRAGRRAAFR